MSRARAAAFSLLGVSRESLRRTPRAEISTNQLGELGCLRKRRRQYARSVLAKSLDFFSSAIVAHFSACESALICMNLQGIYSTKLRSSKGKTVNNYSNSWTKHSSPD